jgi:hypothetical protein
MWARYIAHVGTTYKCVQCCGRKPKRGRHLGGYRSKVKRILKYILIKWDMWAHICTSGWDGLL